MGYSAGRLFVSTAAVVIAMGGESEPTELHRFVTTALRIALLDFEDEAGFQGKWNLAVDVPHLLGQYLSREQALAIVPQDSVAVALTDESVDRLLGVARSIQVGRLLRADVVITGRVEKFGMRRFTAGDPNLLGYKKYNSSIDINEVQLVQVASGRVMETVEVNRDSTESPLGVDLFGRPRKQDREFLELFRVEFGSEAFFELPFGHLADIAFKDLSSEIVQILVDRPPIDLSAEQAVVLAVEENETNEIYLGIGHADGVEYGDILPLLQAAEQVALARVHQLIGPHLCKAVVLEGHDVVEAGLSIGQRISRARHIDLDVATVKKEP